MTVFLAGVSFITPRATGGFWASCTSHLQCRCLKSGPGMRSRCSTEGDARDRYKLGPALVLAVLLALSLTPASAQQVAEIQLNPQQTPKKECIAQSRVAEGAGTFTTTSGQVIPFQVNTKCACIHQDRTASPH